MGIVCYILAGLLLAGALVVPVVGFIAVIIVSAWSAAASNMAFTDRLHDPGALVFELVFEGIVKVLDALGPIPAILVALITIIVEIGLILSAVLLILIGRRLRKTRPKPL